MQAPSSIPVLSPWPPGHAARCPLCGGANGCAEESARITGRPREECWCMQAEIPAAALAAIPAEVRGQACICARCAAQSGAVFPDPN